MMGIGEAWRLRLDYDSAEVWFRRAHDVRRATGDPRIAETDQALAFTLYNIAVALADTIRRTALMREAEQLNLEVMRQANVTPQLRVRALQGLGDVALYTDRPDTAVARYRRALELGERELNANHPDNARTRWGLAEAFIETGDSAAAETAYEEAIEIMTRVYGRDHQETAVAHYNLANLLYATARPADAALHYHHAIEIAANAGQALHAWSALAWLGLTTTAIARKDGVGAVRSFREAKQILRNATSGNESLVCEYTQDYFKPLANLGATGEAAASLTSCYGVWKDNPAQVRIAWQAADDLARLYQTAGRTDSASVWRERRAAIDTLR
jgi:tetratricopeptide (TPR) repeat protein